MKGKGRGMGTEGTKQEKWEGRVGLKVSGNFSLITCQPEVLPPVKSNTKLHYQSDQFTPPIIVLEGSYDAVWCKETPFGGKNVSA
jgi:hypothetical protein